MYVYNHHPKSLKVSFLNLFHFSVPGNHWSAFCHLRFISIFRVGFHINYIIQYFTFLFFLFDFFKQQNACEVQSYFGMYQQFFTFYCQIVFHPLIIPEFFSPFTHWLTFESFPHLFWIDTLNSYVWFFVQTYIFYILG